MVAKGKYSDFMGSPTLNTKIAETSQYAKNPEKAKMYREALPS
jgi:hypothetical protein